jgi:outer membrane protein assembly factor BamA
LLAQGFFRDVTIAMRKGSARGQVIIDVKVVERGTLTLNRLWFGYSDFAHGWAGIDMGDRNLLGLGLSIGAGIIYAAPGDNVPDSQAAAELRIGINAIRGSRWSTAMSITSAHGNDYVGREVDTVATAFAYERLTARVSTSYDLTPLTRLSAQLRGERLTVPSTGPADLIDGKSVVNTLAVAFDHDTRRDPILPHNGARIALVFEGSTRALPLRSDYAFSTLFAQLEQWVPIRQNRSAIGVKLAGGHVFGAAPRFDRIYINDIDPMLAPRALGLLLSTAAPVHFFGDRLADRSDPAIGITGGLASVELTTEMFRGPGRRRVYGGDVFVATGVWTLDVPGYGYSADLYVDAGVRFDTEVGIFELTVGNAIGRLR